MSRDYSAITYFYKKNEIVCAIYTYTSGSTELFGLMLSRFLLSKNIIPLRDYKCFETREMDHWQSILLDEENNKYDVAFGIECLAAQVICHFKTMPGAIYMVPPALTKDLDHAYRYLICEDKAQIYDNKIQAPIFKGSFKEFNEFCRYRIDL